MLKPFKRSRELVVDFGERCSQVCDAGCSQAAPREQTLGRGVRS
jgi:hypothetical protein